MEDNAEKLDLIESMIPLLESMSDEELVELKKELTNKLLVKIK